MKQFFKKSILLLLYFYFNAYAQAYDFEMDGVYYTYDKSTQSAFVTSGDIKYKDHVIIPSSVTYNGRTLEVAAIGIGAFQECEELTSVDIPNSVKTIKEWGFYGCKKLNTIIIPNTVTTIEDNVFENCTGLETIVFEDGENDLALGNYNSPLGNIDGNYDYYEEKINPKYLYIGRHLGHRYDDGLVRIDYIDINIMSIEAFAIGNNTKVVPLRVKEPKIPQGNANNKLKYIFSFNMTPPWIITDLPSSIYVNTILYVPIGAKTLYQEHDCWKDFFLIEEMDTNDMWNGNGIPNGNPTNIKTIIFNKETENKIYDLQGRCISKPVKGIYIKDGKKVVIK